MSAGEKAKEWEQKRVVVVVVVGGGGVVVVVVGGSTRWLWFLMVEDNVWRIFLPL